MFSQSLLMSPPIAGVIALVIAIALYLRVKSLPSGNETMNRIATYIREGSMAFLVREYKVLAVYAVVVGAALWYALGPISAMSFPMRSFPVFTCRLLRYESSDLRERSYDTSGGHWF